MRGGHRSADCGHGERQEAGWSREFCRVVSVRVPTTYFTSRVIAAKNIQMGTSVVLCERWIKEYIAHSLCWTPHRLLCVSHYIIPQCDSIQMTATGVFISYFTHTQFVYRARITLTPFFFLQVNAPVLASTFSQDSHQLIKLGEAVGAVLQSCATSKKPFKHVRITTRGKTTF